MPLHVFRLCVWMGNLINVWRGVNYTGILITSINPKWNFTHALGVCVNLDALFQMQDTKEIYVACSCFTILQTVVFWFFLGLVCDITYDLATSRILYLKRLRLFYIKHLIRLELSQIIF